MADNNLPAVQYYTPIELVGIYRTYLEKSKTNNVICLRGVYHANPNASRTYSYAYDALRDASTNDCVTLKVSWQDRQKLVPNSLILVWGLVDLKPKNNGNIQIEVTATRFEIVKDQFISEAELKLFELRKQKSAKGLKNVNAAISEVIIQGKRPKIALIIAETTKTQGDFEDGLRAARASIDFEETKLPLTRTDVLCDTLRFMDDQHFDAIAIYRGGGIDSNTDVDKPEFIEVVVNLKTPFISGVGHKPEQIFLREVADFWTATPQGLGQYFSDIVETASARRNNSRAALIEEVKKQFIKQIDESNKKNKELLLQVEKMTKQAQEQTKANQEAQKKQMEENTKNLQKVQEENKKNLEAQQKKNDEALAKFQAQSKAQLAAASKQNEDLQKKLVEFNGSLKKMQETNGELNKSLQKLTAQNAQSNKDLNDAKDKARQLEKQLEEALSKNKGCSSGCLGIVATIVTIASAACWIVCLIM